MPQLLRIGTVVDSMYEITGVIGSGAMGAVYQATDKLKGKSWALKELAPINPDPNDKMRFEREATMLANLDHPHLPKVHAYFDDNGKYYLVMDLIPGQNLSELLNQNHNHSGLPEWQIVKILHSTLDVMNFLHSQNPPIIFRDMKPDNLIVDQNGKIWLVDFGIAVFAQVVSTSVSTGQMQAVGTAAHGTPEYAAPEQALGANVQTDLYNLGTTMYYLATGEQPKSGQPLREVSAIRKDLSPILANTINWLARWSAKDRPQSVLEVQSKLNTNGSTLEHLRKTNSSDIEAFISGDKGWGKFDNNLLGPCTQLIEYLNNELYEHALKKIGQILSILGGFFSFILNNGFFSNNIDEENKRILEYRIFLMHCKINILLKLKSPKKAKSQVVQTLKRYKGVDEMFVLAEFYEQIDDLEYAKRIFKQIAEKHPKEPSAFQGLKRVEDKLEARKQKAKKSFLLRFQNISQRIKNIGFGIGRWFKKQFGWQSARNLLWAETYSCSILFMAYLIGVILGYVFHPGIQALPFYEIEVMIFDLIGYLLLFLTIIFVRIMIFDNCRGDRILAAVFSIIFGTLFYFVVIFCPSQLEYNENESPFDTSFFYAAEHICRKNNIAGYVRYTDDEFRDIVKKEADRIRYERDHKIKSKPLSSY
ncbi:hypothetical protein A3F08_02735 [Candidatus Berkelbacteria bacterium RIFCSPHIGHO2_12_FULL_36_9]|uniref:non-specific serine/threonine protein kinase n=1 Tax=Candidatus Berkelbacteria bacterium RIFCSPHIGHO2_12_FULL_36_9 TaxID=1797469 RepID=A0A1F5EDY8_9BACT|nr:MAG: hypothetical protein A3F08_02735 [Candidatus Berkelbacteria bacterium RIFCSPHIGHO2_12_FULL_36_9]